MQIDINDPQAAYKAFEQLESGIELGVEQEPEPTEPPKVEKEGTEQKPEQREKQQTEQQEAEPEGVATKDGKHVIPYSVLKSERERAARAEALAREYEERLKALESAANGEKQGEPSRAQETAGIDDLSDADLEALKEDFPTVYKAVMASMKAAQAIESKIKPTVDEIQQDRARSVAETVQEAIDSVPKLAYIQANEPEAFELAQQIDATLRGQSRWADRPLSERFAKVVEMVEAAGFDIKLPTAAKAAQPVDVKKEAMAKVQQAKKAIPTSLSDFPGGDPAAEDEAEAAEQLTHMQLAEKFARMTPEQMDAYLNSL